MPATQPPAALLAGLLSVIAPRRCLACGVDRPPLGPPPAPARPWEEGLCRGCRGEVEVLGPACRGCGRGLGPHAQEAARCRACRGVPLGAVRSTTALLRYRGPARTLLRRLKYGGAFELASPLGRALASRVRERLPDLARDPTLVVVPVPLHPWRRWRRGYNQAERIAAAVAEVLERPLVPALVRRRATRPLYGVPREARAGVVEGAFALAGGVDLGGRRVALVDDIRTSGATLRCAAGLLAGAGAARVDALVVGR